MWSSEKRTRTRKEGVDGELRAVKFEMQSLLYWDDGSSTITTSSWVTFPHPMNHSATAHRKFSPEWRRMLLPPPRIMVRPSLFGVHGMEKCSKCALIMNIQRGRRVVGSYAPECNVVWLCLQSATKHSSKLNYSDGILLFTILLRHIPVHYEHIILFYAVLFLCGPATDSTQSHDNHHQQSP